jgi:hypothetical protein
MLSPVLSPQCPVSDATCSNTDPLPMPRFTLAHSEAHTTGPGQSLHDVVMAEHYLNVLTVRLRGYGAQPVPESLVEELALEITDVGSVDVDRLAEELKREVGEGPRSVRQNITEFGWGASGSWAELIIDVPTWLSGLASLPVLWDTITRRIVRLGQPRQLDAQSQAELARGWLADSLNIGTASIKIVGLQPRDDGHRVELQSRAGVFDVDMDGGGVVRMQRRSPGAPNTH